MLDQYLWVVVAGGIAAFAAAMGIGANDSGNAMASSVGAKSLTLRQAILVSAIFEFLGAFLLGSHVTETIRKGITDVDYFADRPDLLMFAMFCVIVSVGIWLALATALSLPVSTTHTAVGGVIGVAVVARGWEAVNWEKVILIVVSWFASPLLSGLVSMAIYALVRCLVLRHAASATRAFLLFPVLVGCTVAINAFFIIYKGLPVFPEVAKLPIEVGFGIAIGLGVLCALMTQFLAVPAIRKRVSGMNFADEKTADVEEGSVSTPTSPSGVALASGQATPTSGSPAAQVDDVSPGAAVAAAKRSESKDGVELAPISAGPKSGPETVTTTSSKATPVSEPDETRDVAVAAAGKPKRSGFIAALRHGIDVDIHATSEGRLIQTKAAKRVKAMHDRAESFPQRTEHTFTYLQVFTACLDALSHGANDTANSLGPFAAVYGIYASGVATSKAPVPLWILALGGAGIVVGLSLFGYKIIQALGTEMTKITPSRGFTIELGAALIIIVGSRLGIPLSTTHCQVGSTVGVGLLEKEPGKAVNWRQLAKVASAWVLTLVFAACFSGGLYAFCVYAPSAVTPVLANATLA
ncbi:hypothetical protein FNF31_05682 [Cafeteria roenbergensis]|uniref:Phosphate transporter n=1 Tax=Cafeteria roenbergensis TaxID=33653 RepID=A0A5A8DH54_CAFRO|nr:hypothetical protein FNF31_05682 [Cafeteria roenbergensis]KAA0164662.1 hypothetical protein FNF28_03723 [Cafeteria roenbergensis]